MSVEDAHFSNICIQLLKKILKISISCNFIWSSEKLCAEFNVQWNVYRDIG